MSISSVTWQKATVYFNQLLQQDVVQKVINYCKKIIQDIQRLFIKEPKKIETLSKFQDEPSEDPDISSEMVAYFPLESSVNLEEIVGLGPKDLEDWSNEKISQKKKIEIRALIDFIDQHDDLAPVEKILFMPNFFELVENKNEFKDYFLQLEESDDLKKKSVAQFFFLNLFAREKGGGLNEYIKFHKNKDKIPKEIFIRLCAYYEKNNENFLSAKVNSCYKKHHTNISSC